MQRQAEPEEEEEEEPLQAKLIEGAHLQRQVEPEEEEEEEEPAQAKLIDGARLQRQAEPEEEEEEEPLQAKLIDGARLQRQVEEEEEEEPAQAKLVEGARLQRQVEEEEEEEPLQAKLADGARLQRQVEPEEEEEEEPAQTKLIEGARLQRQVEEEEEEEPAQAKLAEGTRLQRQVESEEEEEELQAKVSSGNMPSVTPGLAANIQPLQSGGQPLPEATRAFFEPRFGYSFGQVRVHSDAKAAKAARAVNALAYTVGRNIVFGAGKYSPGSVDGRRLLAHELAHVVQQSGGTVPLHGKVSNGVEQQRMILMRKPAQGGKKHRAPNWKLQQGRLDIDVSLSPGDSLEQVEITWWSLDKRRKRKLLSLEGNALKKAIGGHEMIRVPEDGFLETKVKWSYGDRGAYFEISNVISKHRSNKHAKVEQGTLNVHFTRGGQGLAEGADTPETTPREPEEFASLFDKPGVAAGAPQAGGGGGCTEKPTWRHDITVPHDITASSVVDFVNGANAILGSPHMSWDWGFDPQPEFNNRNRATRISLWVQTRIETPRLGTARVSAAEKRLIRRIVKRIGKHERDHRKDLVDVMNKAVCDALGQPIRGVARILERAICRTAPARFSALDAREGRIALVKNPAGTKVINFRLEGVRVNYRDPNCSVPVQP